MRQLTDHIVSGDQAAQLEVYVFDKRGVGGASHAYLIERVNNSDRNPSAGAFPGSEPPGVDLRILFQNGPLGKHTLPNGVTNEALLAILIDRLRGFQSGKFACRENAQALSHLERALSWMQKRTLARIKRGVEGTRQK